MTGVQQQYQRLPGFATLLWRGFQRKCPCCGNAKIFDGYLRLRGECASCGLELGAIRADDFPPYVTILVVGHIVVPGLLMTQRYLDPSMTFQLAVWLPVTLGLCLWLLPKFKGLVVGLMLHVGLKGGEYQ